MAGSTTFDRKLFDEFVHYIAWRMREDEHFGRVKLAKTLFYADFGAYEEEGKPLTGARYFHWPKGPFTYEVYRAEERLVEDGIATLKEPEFEGDEAKLYAQNFEPTRSEGWQRIALDLRMDELAKETSRAVSDRSHEHPGWLVTKYRQEIPYEAVHVSRTGPTQEDLEAAQKVAREHGWL